MTFLFDPVTGEYSTNPIEILVKNRLEDVNIKGGTS
jgi:hypothetical protein